MANTFILTDNNLTIIDKRQTFWNTPGEYKDDCFKIIVCETPAGKEVDYIESSGTVSPPEKFEIEGKDITCNHIYRNATVIFKDIPEVI
jgi:hypothetical protein